MTEEYMSEEDYNDNIQYMMNRIEYFERLIDIGKKETVMYYENKRKFDKIICDYKRKIKESKLLYPEYNI